MSGMKGLSPRSLLALLGCLGVAIAWAADAPPVDPRVDIAKKIPGAKVEQLKPTPIPGMYEFARGTDIGYVTSDGRYFFGGDLYDIKEGVNLTDQRRNDARRVLLDTLSDSEMIVFSPKEPKYTITVFTDVDCGYCRKLHSEIADLNRRGVRVRYAFYPREGPGSESWKVAEAVWCSANRQDALTRAKRGEEIKAKDCGATPVAREYQMALDLNVHGTPGIFTPEGDYISGYLPPAQLVAHLKSLKEDSQKVAEKND
ncbi:MAG TPA: DsbC family protein [Steroidobacteraceae bacterium]|nr:DsbC family protein [Steroidobacteraceae bacterium]